MSQPPARPRDPSPLRLCLHRYPVVPAESDAQSSWFERVRRWRPADPVKLAVVVATAVFALAGIGSPLIGLRVFADTGTLANYSGYRDVLSGVQVHTEGLRD